MSTPATVALVLAGGAVGAPTRYLVDRWVQRRVGSAVPWGTGLVNLAGCLLLGAVAGADGPAWLRVLLGTGFCGALTTFSTFGVEVVRLAEEDETPTALGYLVGSVVLGLALCAAGFAAASALT